MPCPRNILGQAGLLEWRPSAVPDRAQDRHRRLRDDGENDEADDRLDDGDDDDIPQYLVLENASVGPFFNSPGLVLGFAATHQPPTVLANYWTRPTAMTFDRRMRMLYVTDLVGHVVAIPVLWWAQVLAHLRHPQLVRAFTTKRKDNLVAR